MEKAQNPDRRTVDRLDHPLRCQTNRKHRGPCMLYSAIESRDENGKGYCRFHGGHKRRGQTYKRKSLPLIYSQNLGPKLSKVLETVTKPDDEVTDLVDELALSRTVLADFVGLFQIVEETDSVKLKIALSQACFAMIKDVAAIAEKAQKIKDAKRTTVDVRDLGTIVNQINVAFHEVVGDNPELIGKLAKVIDETVRLPQAGGTTLTTDHDALMMDGSVPKYETVLDVTPEN